MEMQWFYIYGNTATYIENSKFRIVKSDDQEKMDKGILEGTHYKCSILLSSQVIENADSKTAIDFNPKWSQKLEPPMFCYIVFAFFFLKQLC